MLAIAAQVWLGVLLQFDGMEGPLTRFSPEKSAAAITMPGPLAGIFSDHQKP